MGVHTTLPHALIGKGNYKTTRGDGKAGCHLAALALSRKYRMFVGLTIIRITQQAGNVGPASQVGL